MKNEVKALISYRIQQAKDAREEAEILFEKGKLRGALNRIYYSMFYATLALLASKELSSSKHAGVISLFHREFVKTGMISTQVARSLNIAFDLRTKSDYREFIEIEQIQINELLEASYGFIGVIESILTDESEIRE